MSKNFPSKETMLEKEIEETKYHRCVFPFVWSGFHISSKGKKKLAYIRARVCVCVRVRA